MISKLQCTLEEAKIHFLESNQFGSRLFIYQYLIDIKYFFLTSL